MEPGYQHLPNVYGSERCESFLVSQIFLFLRVYFTDYGILDHALWLWLRDRERRDYALLLPEHGPGLPGLGVLVVGYWSLLVSDFRRCGWYSSVSSELLAISDVGLC